MNKFKIFIFGIFFSNLVSSDHRLADLAGKFLRAHSGNSITSNNLELGFKDTQGNTVLHLAATEHNVELVNLLNRYSQKFDCNAQNQNGDTALHIACKKRSDILIKALLQFKNMQCDILNNNQRAPLDEYCSFGQASCPQEIQDAFERRKSLRFESLDLMRRVSSQEIIKRKPGIRKPSCALL